MKLPSSFRIDPSIGVSLLAVGLFVGTFGVSRRTLLSLIQIAWLYLTNARG